MKRLLIYCFLLVGAIGFAADDIWTITLADKDEVNQKNTPEVVSGGTKIDFDGEILVMTFSPAREPAKFKSLGILNNSHGFIEMMVKPNIPSDPKQHTNNLFFSKPYTMGFNVSKEGKTAVFFLTTTQKGAPAGIYKVVPLKNGQWHHFRGVWDSNTMSFYLDGVLQGKSGRGESLFGETFQIGGGGWGWSDCRIKDVKISGGESKTSSPEKKNDTITKSAVITYPVTVDEVHATFPFPFPFDTLSGSGNLLGNNDFSRLDALEPDSIQQMKNENFVVRKKEIPVGWELLFQGKAPCASGNLEIFPLKTPSGKNGHGITLSLPNNKWKQVEFRSRQPLAAKEFRKQNLHGGFWARGEGTLTLFLREFTSGNLQPSTTEISFLLSPEWKFYRTDSLKIKQATTTSVRLGFTVYGTVDLAMIEVAPLPAVDRSASLSFYTPFDKGSPTALYSSGTGTPLGVGDETIKVPGIIGDAIRIDRKRQITKNGFLRVPMGYCYEGMKDVIDCDAGTIEFWFRPLPEMLEKQKWAPFRLLTVGRALWKPGAPDMRLDLKKKEENIFLSLLQGRRTKDFPSRKTLSPSSDQREDETLLGKASSLMNTWHHLALTYDDKETTVWMDGKKIIQTPAMKQPPVVRTIVGLGTDHVALPFLASCDFDELKIYKGVRYHGTFTPLLEPLKFHQNPGKESVWPEKAKLQAGMPVLSSDGTKVLYPLMFGSEKYNLELSLGNGYPLVFSSHKAAMDIKTGELSDLPDLPLKSTLHEMRASGTIKERDTDYTWSVKETDNGVRVELHLEKKKGFWKALLEPRLSLKNLSSNSWMNAFDGYTVFPILSPFRKHAYSEMVFGLPLTAAWNRETGMALVLSPEVITSYIRRGMNHPDSINLAVRTVLDAGDNMDFSFEIFPFRGKYGSASAIEIYQRNNPSIFSRKRNVDPRVYTGNGLEPAWDTPAYQKRKKWFSRDELNRRARTLWYWLYKSGTSTGNWAPDMEVLREFSKLNRYEVANAEYHQAINDNKAHSLESLKGCDPALYISSFMEERLRRYFNDSSYDDKETGNYEFRDNYWWPGIRDWNAIQTGTSYGVWLRKQMSYILNNYPYINTFAHDELVGDYRFRKANSMGGARAFDEEGPYTHNLAAMGAFCQDVIQMKNRTPYETAIISNARIYASGFPAMFRTSNNIFERYSHEAMQDWTTLRQHALMMGEKPNSFFPAFPDIVGNYFNPDREDPRVLRFFLIAYTQQQVLLSMLFNLKTSYNILGVKESVLAQEELARVQNYGYRPVAPVKNKEGILSACYGDPALGAFAFVNASCFPAQTPFQLDLSYWNNVPLLALRDETLSVKNASGVLAGIAPLSWKVLEMQAAVPGNRPLEYTSALKTTRDKRELTVTFASDADLSGTLFGLAKYEVPLTLTLNGKKIDFEHQNAAVKVKKLPVAKGDVLKFAAADSRWKSCAKEIASLPYLEKEKLAVEYQGDEGVKIQAQKIVEYFRYWTLMVNKKPFVAPLGIKPGEKASVRVRLEIGAPGIELQNNTVSIRGGNLFELMEMTEEFLYNLDSKYPYYGVYGEQRGTKPLDNAETEEKRTLNARADVIGKTMSVETVVREFQEYCREKNIQPDDLKTF